MSGPAQHPLEPEAEPDEVVRQALVPELVRRSMARYPGAVAISGEVDLTYGELARLVTDVAARLREHGVMPGAYVGICVPKSAVMVAALLAVWECGAISVPLPDSDPGERAARIVRDCGAHWILVTAGTSVQVAGADTVALDRPENEHRPGAAPPADLAPSDTAYVMYTSGSSGLPKGVVMSHRAFASVVRWQLESTARTHDGRPPRAVQFTPLTFDVSYLEICSGLAAGGTLLLPTEEQRRDPVLLFDMMVRARATSVFLPHVMLHAVADVATGARDRQSPGLRHLITGGEQLIVTEGIRNWFRRLPHCRLQNIYGPTETHVVTMYELTGDPAGWPRLPPVGCAIPGATLHLRDDRCFPVAPGEVGELWISGPCVGEGYLHQPELTAQRFVSDPQTGVRMYRSGDLLRDLGDGVLQYVSRTDSQIKIRGAVVDPSGVEALLADHPQVQACAVVARDGVGGKRLVAYVVPTAFSGGPGEDLVTRTADPVLVRHLLAHLPDWSVPDTFVYLPVLPVSPSGKIDRKALPEPSRARPAIGRYRAEQTPAEARLVVIWSRLLQLNEVGTADRFFDLGGNSLLLTRLQAEVAREFGRDIGVAELMEHPTIQDLASYLDLRGEPADVYLDPDELRGPESARARRAEFRARGRKRRSGSLASSFSVSAGSCNVRYYFPLPPRRQPGNG